MTFLRVHCAGCGRKWDVYKHSIKSEFSRECPNCYRQVDEQLWQSQVIPAFCSVDDANIELLKEHHSSNKDDKPLFTIDVITGKHNPKIYNTI